MLALLVVVALLVAWLLTSGGGGSDQKSAGDNGKGPAPSITPGPSGSGPAITEQPGGRDEADDGGASGGTNGSEGDGGDGSTGGGDSQGASGGAGGGGSSTGGGAADQVPAGSSLPTCTSGAVTLTLHTTNSYGPGEKPRLELVAKNTSSTACKWDFGPAHTVLTITRVVGDERLWASDDCPSDDGSFFLRVPAGTSITHPVVWDRKPSAPHCGTPPAKSASPGTYLVELKAPGFPRAQASFVLDKD